MHGLIAHSGLDQFYDLQDGSVQPVKSLVFQKRDHGWLETLAREAEREPIPKLELDIQGVSCLACAWLIEKLFAREDGGLEIRVDPACGRLELRWRAGAFDVAQFAGQLQRFGYLLGPPGKDRRTAGRALLLRRGICAALAMNTMLFTLPKYLGLDAHSEYAPFFQRCAFLLATLSMVIGGSYFFVRCVRSLRVGVLPLDLPISAGLIAAYAGSVYAWVADAHAFIYFDFVSTFTFLMLVGRWLQQAAVERNRNQLLSSRVAFAPVREAASGKDLPVTEIDERREFSVAPGQLIPVRARLLSEDAALNLEWINGESEAVSIHRGSEVSAGSINCGQERLTLSALESWGASLLARLTKISSAPAERNRVLEAFIARYLLTVLALTVFGFCWRWSVTGTVAAGLQALISILVVSCPCASGVAIPLCSDLAASRLRRLGVFIRNGGLWAKLDHVRTIVFDKTGTLTLESISLRNPESLLGLSPEEGGVLLHLVEANPHPVSRALYAHLLSKNVRSTSAEPVHERVGAGLEVRHGNALWRLGRPEWAGGASGDCVFSRDGQILASLWFGEEARKDAVEEIDGLGRQGYQIFVLSGDRRPKVEAMARRLRLPPENCFAELSPQEKADWLIHRGRNDILFLGDGANDSLAFDHAWCTGTPTVELGLLEHKADFYFLGRGLSGVRALLDTAKLRRRAVRSVITFAIAYNAVAIALCLAGLMNPLLAAVLMPASSLASLGIVFTVCRERTER